MCVILVFTCTLSFTDNIRVRKVLNTVTRVNFRKIKFILFDNYFLWLYSIVIMEMTNKKKKKNKHYTTQKKKK